MDATKKPLRIPPEFSIYAEEHGIFDMYKRLLSQLIIDKPKDPIQFTIDWLMKDHHSVPRVAIIGPAASGKSGISAMLTKRIGAIHITASMLLDDELSEPAQEAKALIANSKRVPSAIWVKMIVERLKKKDCTRRGFILEDFPKNRQQALMLQSSGILLTHLVVLKAPDTVLIERQAGKRVDRITGEVYHTTFDWPQDPTVQARLIEPKGISESVTKRRLKDYARYEEAIVSAYPSIHKRINADQPKADVLAQTLTFINKEPRSVAPRTPRVLLIGPTGSGKSTVAAKMAEKYKLVDVSCGSLLKEHVANESKLGMAVKEFVDEGKLVPTTLVNKVVVDRLTQLDAATRGWVLHGFPISRDQADGLSDSGIKPNRIVFFDLPEDCVLERLCYRLVDPVSGERYHTLYNPPRSTDIKDRCVLHPSDGEENVKNSLNDYYAYASELSEYYADDGATRINADQDPLTIFEYIESMLVNPLPNKLGTED